MTSQEIQAIEEAKAAAIGLDIPTYTQRQLLELVEYSCQQVCHDAQWQITHYGKEEQKAALAALTHRLEQEKAAAMAIAMEEDAKLQEIREKKLEMDRQQAVAVWIPEVERERVGTMLQEEIDEYAATFIAEKTGWKQVFPDNKYQCDRYPKSIHDALRVELETFSFRPYAEEEEDYCGNIRNKYMIEACCEAMGVYLYFTA